MADDAVASAAVLLRHAAQGEVGGEHHGRDPRAVLDKAGLGQPAVDRLDHVNFLVRLAGAPEELVALPVVDAAGPDAGGGRSQQRQAEDED